MKIYTKSGDRGTTGLFGNVRADKTSPRIQTIGTIDEANAVLGMYEFNTPYMRNLIMELQSMLFNVGADLAAPHEDTEYVIRISEEDTQFLENQIDYYSEKLPPLKNFILPNGPLHLARTIVRRAEREFNNLINWDTNYVNYEIQRFLNRLSDLLFVLARYDNLERGIGEREWRQETE